MIDRPGIIEGMKMETYLSDPAPEPSLSSGTVKSLLHECPRKVAFCNSRLNPSYKDECEDKFDIGVTAHSLLLEGLDVAVVVDEDSWRTKASKEAKAKARTEGKVPLLAHQYPQVKAMVEAAKQQLLDSELKISNLQAEGRSELSFFWQINGIWCRSRPDWLSNDNAIMISYKTTRVTANPAQVERMIDPMGWDSAAAFYIMGAEELLGTTPAYIYMIQEVTAPYLCSFVSLTPQYLDLGRQKTEKAIPIWAECLLMNQWPSYPSRIAYVEPRPWVLTQWAERMVSEVTTQDISETW